MPLYSNKYGAKKTVIDGQKFDSKFEAEYYGELKLREKAGEIKILELQPKVYLSQARILYRPDFLILDGSDRVYIDVKGFKTVTFAIKKRLWKAYCTEKLKIVYRNKIEVVN